MEQNHMLMEQLNVSKTVVNEQPSQFYVMPGYNKNISSFTGRETGQVARDWLQTFIGVAKINKWSDALRIESVPANLSGPAQQWFRSRIFATWEDFERKFMRSFVNIQSRTESWHSLVAKSQLKNETTIDYFYDKYDCAAIWNCRSKKQKHNYRGILFSRYGHLSVIKATS